MKRPWIILIQLISCLLLDNVHSFSLNIGGQKVDTTVGNNVGGGFEHVRFSFQYGLPEGLVTGQGDVESLLCRTQDYLTQELNKEFVDLNLQVKATGIVWAYDKNNADMPVRVNFTASVTGINGTEVPEAEEIRDATMDLDMESYLSTVVQASECPTGFSQATKASYINMLTPEIRGDLSEASCQSTCAPTLTPGVPTRMCNRNDTTETSRIQ